MIGRLARYLVRKAVISLVLADDTPYPRAQVTANGVTKDTLRFSPYGYWSNPPLDALGLVFALNGRPDDTAAIFDTPKARYDQLEESEVKMGVPSVGSFIHFKKNGDVIFKVPKGNLSLDLDQGGTTITLTGDVTIEVQGALTISATDGFEVEGDTVMTGNLEITGDIDVTGAVTVSQTIDATGAISTDAGLTAATVAAATTVTAGVISLTTHTHTHGAGPGTTGLPLP